MKSLLVLTVALAAPAAASADVLTYYPSGAASSCSGGSTACANDLGDLDHHFYYAWTIGLISIPAGQQITNAYITFQNLYNWDSNKNVLFMDLLDNPVNGNGTLLNSATNVPTTGTAPPDSYNTTVRYASDPDVAAGSSPVTSFIDEFEVTGANASILTSGPNTGLSDHSFLPDNLSPLVAGDLQSLRNVLTTGSPVLPGTYADIGGVTQPQWSVVQEPGAGGVGKFDYTYTFTAAQLGQLAAYIGPAGGATRDITLAFDPDCHFFNDGVSFTIVTGQLGQTAVPEPASLLLLGTGLMLCARRYRRKNSNTPS